MAGRALFAFGISLIALLAVSGCVEPPEPPIRVGLLVWPAYEMPFLARELGYYDDASISLLSYETPAEVFRAYRNGLIDVLALTSDYFMQLVESDPNHCVVLVADVSNGGDAILARPECPGFGVSKKCTIGVEGSAIGAYMLNRALDLNAISLEDVTTKFVDIPDQEAGYLSGELDIVVTYEPTRSNLLNQGAVEIFSSEQIPGEIVDVVITSKDLARERSQDLRALVQGWLRARDYLEENPEDAARRVCGREGVSPEQYLKSLEGVVLPDKETNLKMLAGQSPAILDTLRNLCDVMIDAGMLSKSIQADDHVTADYILDEVP